MAVDGRDWYRDWWRKRTGYVERSAFRVSEGVRQRGVRRQEWRRIFWRLLWLGLVLCAAIALKRLL